MSFFGGGSSKKPEFHPPSEHIGEQDALFGPLEPNDLFWKQAGGFVTETQTFYNTTPTGQIVMFQVIHSAVGLWNPNIQLTFACFDKSKRIWKSINVSHFKCPPAPHLDKRSSKADQFSITVDPNDPDTYVLEGTYDDQVQVSLRVTRSPNVPGWKVGMGPKGGFSYFGALVDKPSQDPKEPDYAAGSDGYVIHRFWPRTEVKGIVRMGQNMIDMEGSKGVFVHAIQGMRPNLVACRWNFANFQSLGDDGTSLIMMEFTTTSQYGRKVVNVGSIVHKDKLLAVTLNTDPHQSDCQHNDRFLDQDTGYNVPQEIEYTWKGPFIADPSQSVSAKLQLDLVEDASQKPSCNRGLAEKVDVLAEIPYFIKKVVNVVSGAKPYIYQYVNEAEATLQLPAHDGQEAQTVKVIGQLFNECSYVSEDP